MTDACNKLSRAEVALLSLGLLTTFRICLMPAMLSEAAGESAVYVMLTGMAVDVAVTLTALAVAAKGGMRALPLPGIVKRMVGGLLALFFLFKVAAHAYEVVSYCANDLFEQTSPLVLMAVLVLTAALLSAKGFAGIARTGMMYVPVVLLLAVLSVFFVAPCGYGYNLWVLLRPRNVGTGLLQSMLWVGDGAVWLLADLRDNHAGKGQGRGWIAASMAVALVGITAFYLNFVYTYGSAGQYVQYAFVRLLTNGDPEELGAVDWPVLLIWLLSVPLVLATLLHGGVEALRLCVGTAKRGYVLLSLSAIGVGVTYCLLFADGDGFVRLTANTALAYTLIGVTAVSVAVVLWGMARHRPGATA